MRIQELLNEVTIRTMQFYTVKTRCYSVFSRLGKVPHYSSHLICSQCSWLRTRYESFFTRCIITPGKGVSRTQIRCTHRCLTFRLIRRMRYTAHMPQLGEDGAALCMYRICNLFPAGYLLRGI
ncbi:hypothetical protein D9M68_973150 [compost metagenome]